MSASAPAAGRTWARCVLRIVFFVVSASLCILTLPGLNYPEWQIRQFDSKKFERIASIKVTEDVRKAIDYRVDLSRSLFQATLIILGGFWSIILAKKEEAAIVFHDGCAIGMLVFAHIVLFSAGWEHIQFVMDMSSLLAAVPAQGGNIPDIDANYVKASLLAQFVRVFAALVVSTLTLLSAKWR